MILFLAFYLDLRNMVISLADAFLRRKLTEGTGETDSTDNVLIFVMIGLLVVGICALGIGLLLIGTTGTISREKITIKDKKGFCDIFTPLL